MCPPLFNLSCSSCNQSELITVRLQLTKITSRKCNVEVEAYLDTLLKTGCLILSIFGYGGDGSVRNTRPRSPTQRRIPILIRWLLQLRPYFHWMVRVGFHQRLGREKAQICMHTKEIQITHCSFSIKEVRYFMTCQNLETISSMTKKRPSFIGCQLLPTTCIDEVYCYGTVFQRCFTHFEGGCHSANDGDGMLKAELLQLITERVLLVLQVNAGSRRKELLTGQPDLRRILRLRRRQLV